MKAGKAVSADRRIGMEGSEREDREMETGNDDDDFDDGCFWV